MKYISIYEKFKEEEIDSLYSWVKKHGNQRIHLSSDEVGEVLDSDQKKSTIKPSGFWYGFGTDWLRFCKYDLEDRFERTKHAYAVEVDRSNLLIIVTKEDLYNFVKKYSDEQPNQKSLVGSHTDMTHINWERVSMDYSGIEFPTYNKFNFRNIEGLPTRVFVSIHTIDAPSGCIWDSSAVKKITKLI